MIVNSASIKIIPKGWGHEKIIVNNDQYCGKLLYLIKGCKTSFHYHQTKHETFYIERGKVKVYFTDEIDEVKRVINMDDGARVPLLFAPNSALELNHVVLKDGDKFDVPRLRGHRIVALEDTKLFEFSTHHEDSDSIRLITGDTIKGEEK